MFPIARQRLPAQRKPGGSQEPVPGLMFDLNDFDETLPGPFEYDVKRMAASLPSRAAATGTPAQTPARRR